MPIGRSQHQPLSIRVQASIPPITDLGPVQIPKQTGNHLLARPILIQVHRQIRHLLIRQEIRAQENLILLGLVIHTHTAPVRTPTNDH